MDEDAELIKREGWYPVKMTEWDFLNNILIFLYNK